MILWCNKLHKMLVHHICIFTCKCAFHISVYNTLVSNLKAVESERAINIGTVNLDVLSRKVTNNVEVFSRQRLGIHNTRILGECQDFCVWGGYSRGSPTRLPFVFEMQYARPDAIAGAKVEGPARSAGGSSLAPAIARREAAGALAREV